MSETEEHHQVLLDAAATVATAVIDTLRDSEGCLHSETAIAAIAATAGALLLRQVLNTELDGLEPGSVVLVDEINDQGMELLGYAMNEAAGLDIEWDASGDDVPDEHRPRESEADLVRTVEPTVVKVLTKLEVERSLWPRCCILSALDVVVRTRDVLDPTVATNIIASSLVAGCKTVPYPAT